MLISTFVFLLYEVTALSTAIHVTKSYTHTRTGTSFFMYQKEAFYRGRSSTRQFNNTRSPSGRSASRSSNFSHRSSSRDSFSSNRSYSSSLSRSPEEPLRTILVENLTRNVTKEHIAEIFGIYGLIDHIFMPIYKKSESNKGYCYVEYVYHDQAANAVDKMNNAELDGEELFVSIKRFPFESLHKNHKHYENSYRPSRSQNNSHYNDKSFHRSRYSRARSRSPGSNISEYSDQSPPYHSYRHRP